MIITILLIFNINILINKARRNCTIRHYLRVVEGARIYGMENNVEINKVMVTSSQSSTVQNVIDQTQLENMEYFSYLSSLLTWDARRIRVFRTAIVKAAFNKK